MHLKNNLKRVLACAGSSLPHTRLLQVWGAGPTLVAVRGLLTAAASPVAEPGPQGSGASALVLRLLNVWIFPDQGSNPCLLPWQLDS